MLYDNKHPHHTLPDCTSPVPQKDQGEGHIQNQESIRQDTLLDQRSEVQQAAIDIFS